jgi:hypothetical protein
MFRRRLFPPTSKHDDSGDAVTEQTFQRAQRPETGEGISIGQMFDSAHDEIMPDSNASCKQDNMPSYNDLGQNYPIKLPTQTRADDRFGLGGGIEAKRV